MNEFENKLDRLVNMVDIELMLSSRQDKEKDEEIQKNEDIEEKEENKADNYEENTNSGNDSDIPQLTKDPKSDDSQVNSIDEDQVTENNNNRAISTLYL